MYVLQEGPETGKQVATQKGKHLRGQSAKQIMPCMDCCALVARTSTRQLLRAAYVGGLGCDFTKKKIKKWNNNEEMKQIPTWVSFWRTVDSSLSVLRDRTGMNVNKKKLYWCDVNKHGRSLRSLLY